MQRVTISMSDGFAAELERFMAENGYANRSEALRDLARLGLERASAEGHRSGECVAILTYVFDHHVREIPKRLNRSYHEHHDLSVATMHVHLDHEHCLEVAVLRGATGEVRAFAQAVIAERGVSHGQITFVPAEVEHSDHVHGGGRDRHPHAHFHPKA